MKPTSTPTASVVRRSLRSTLFVETSLLIALTVLLTTGMAFYLARNEMRRKTFAQLQSIVHGKEDLLENIVSLQREQVAIFARKPSLSSVPEVSNLIGFRSVVLLTESESRLLAGSAPGGEALAQLKALPLGNRTMFIPVFSRDGWKQYIIAAPRAIGGHVVAVFDADPLVSELLDIDYPSKTIDVMIGTRQGDELVLLHTARDADTATPLYLGTYSSQLSQGFPLAKGIEGEEGLEETTDYAGVHVLAAYRSLPSVGWGLVVQIDQYEVYAPILHLAFSMLAIGLSLVGFLSLIMFAFAKHITLPLEELAAKLQGLETKRWKFKRSIFTHNEIEQVDAAAFDLTSRLRQAHEHLEDMVRERTAALQQKNAQDEAVFETMPSGLLVTDTYGKVLLLNAMGEDIAGRKQQDVIGKPFVDVLPLADEGAHALDPSAHPIAGVLRLRRQYMPIPQPKLRLVTKNADKPVFISLIVTPIMRGKQCTGTVAIFRDVTEEQRVDRLKSEFISLVSHQLRTPLSSIRWYLEMLLSKDAGPLNADQQGYVKEASMSNTRMVRLVDALLNVSKIEMGNFQLNVENVDVLAMLKDIENSYASDLKKKKLKISYNFAHKAACIIRADSILLQLVLGNLLSNAVKYSKPGSEIDVSITCGHGNIPSLISVSDQGIGIPAEEQKHIFEKLFRADNAKTSDTDGNGIGLYVSRIAVEAMGGMLTFKSEEKKGTTFFLRIPNNFNAQVKKEPKAA